MGNLITTSEPPISNPQQEWATFLEDPEADTEYCISEFTENKHLICAGLILISLKHIPSILLRIGAIN